MKGIAGAPPRRLSWAGPVVGLLAAAAAGLVLWHAHGGFESPLPEVGLLALAAALGGVWLYRARAARRFFAAVDTYAERELARAERRAHTPSVTGSRALAKRRRHAVTGPTAALPGRRAGRAR